MPAQHRRTYAAIYEMSLASSFTVVPFIASLLAGNANAFRFLALPGGLVITVVPVIVYFALPESPRWHLRRGRPDVAVDIVNRIIARSGNRVSPLTLAALGDHHEAAHEQLPPYWALFAKGQLRWTLVGIFSSAFAGSAFFLISNLLPKALIEQGAVVSTGFAVTSLVYLASIFGKGFTGFLMEIIGRRWTIFYAMGGSLPGLAMMLLAHLAGPFATVMMIAGGLITGFTVLSTFTASRIYLSEQFPTALRGRGHIFGESFGRIFAAGLVPMLVEPYTASPTVFFGTMLGIVAVGAFIPLLFGRETVGQLETVTEGVPALA
jgi:MFS family permease